MQMEEGSCCGEISSIKLKPRLHGSGRMLHWKDEDASWSNICSLTDFVCVCFVNAFIMCVLAEILFDFHF